MSASKCSAIQPRIFSICYWQSISSIVRFCSHLPWFASLLTTAERTTAFGRTRPLDEHSMSARDEKSQTVTKDRTQRKPCEMTWPSLSLYVFRWLLLVLSLASMAGSDAASFRLGRPAPSLKTPYIRHTGMTTSRPIVIPSPQPPNHSISLSHLSATPINQSSPRRPKKASPAAAVMSASVMSVREVLFTTVTVPKFHVCDVDRVSGRSSYQTRHETTPQPSRDRPSHSADGGKCRSKKNSA